MKKVSPARFNELNHHIPKLQLIEIFPLTPFLLHYEGMNTFDVGANIGLWSEAFIKTQGAHLNRHVMFEPLQGNLEHLVRRNRNVLTKLTASTEIAETALGAETGEAEIHFEKETSALASIRNTECEAGRRVIKLDLSRIVPLSTVDAELAERGIDLLHLLKVDVEGYEMNVLNGAEEALRAGRVRNVYFEFGVHQTKNGESFRDFFDFLSDYGFTIYKPVRHRNFFRLGRVSSYSPELEPAHKAVEMVLASQDEPHPDYRGPQVVTRINPKKKVWTSPTLYLRKIARLVRQ